MFKKIFTKWIKPVPGSGIINEIGELKAKWTEGKKVKGVIEMSKYIVGAGILIYLIAQGIISDLPGVMEFLKTFFS